jgi:hypothetical protein
MILIKANLIMSQQREEYMHYQYNLDFKHHVNQNDLMVSKFTCNHDGSLFYVKIENYLPVR